MNDKEEEEDNPLNHTKQHEQKLRMRVAFRVVSCDLVDQSFRADYTELTLAQLRDVFAEDAQSISEVILLD